MRGRKDYGFCQHVETCMGVRPVGFDDFWYDDFDGDGKISESDKFFSDWMYDDLAHSWRKEVARRITRPRKNTTRPSLTSKPAAKMSLA